ncbi:hypothetical protein K439DRAFT_1157255 [Ramaria rubella]|nr:hypothetical protein K439DRAFT_1157255 [Ramaria rubella]
MHMYGMHGVSLTHVHEYCQRASGAVTIRHSPSGSDTYIHRYSPPDPIPPRTRRFSAANPAGVSTLDSRLWNVATRMLRLRDARVVGSGEIRNAYEGGVQCWRGGGCDALRCRGKAWRVQFDREGGGRFVVFVIRDPREMGCCRRRDVRQGASVYN